MPRPLASRVLRAVRDGDHSPVQVVDVHAATPDVPEAGEVVLPQRGAADRGIVRDGHTDVVPDPNVNVRTVGDDSDNLVGSSGLLERVEVGAGVDRQPVERVRCLTVEPLRLSGSGWGQA